MGPDAGRSREWVGGRLVDRNFGLAASLVLFGLPALLLWSATRLVLPALVDRGLEPLVAWFVAGGSLVFAPLFVAAIAGAVAASPGVRVTAVLGHLRVRAMTGAEWRLAGLVILAAYAATGLTLLIGQSLWPGFAPHPPFLTVEALGPERLYILALWLPFFFFNIVGEELWWRGFIQPRQEPVFGRRTYLLQALLHGLFHLSFGFAVLVVLWPVLLAIPWAVQRTRNTTVGIVIHAAINGPGFLAVTLGLLPS